MEKNARAVGFLHSWMQEPGIHLSTLPFSLQASLPGRLSLPSRKRKSIFPINWRKTTGLSLIGPAWVTCPSPCLRQEPGGWSALIRWVRITWPITSTKRKAGAIFQKEIAEAGSPSNGSPNWSQDFREVRQQRPGPPHPCVDGK